jgi:hypothetical protein
MVIDRGRIELLFDVRANSHLGNVPPFLLRRAERHAREEVVNGRRIVSAGLDRGADGNEEDCDKRVSHDG